MFYSEYEKKILKIAKVKSFISKYKIFIISALALIIVGIIALITTKGNVSGNITGPKEIIYGESYNFDGVSASRSDVIYEYSIKGSNEWIEEKPFKPGEYLVRAYSNAAFGKKKYSDISEFIIKAREVSVNITSKTIEYGNAPLYSIDLAENNKISNISFIYEDVLASKTNVMANKESIKIINEDNIDVTSCYSINTPKSEIEIVNRKITAKLEDITHVYDGLKPKYNNKLENISLVFQDTVSYDAYVTDLNNNIVEPINVGKYYNNINNFKVLNGNEDITYRYDVSLSKASIEILKRDIKVKTPSVEKTYDGKELFNDKIELSSDSKYGLALGHRFKVNSYSSATNVGETKNIVSFDIVNENDEIVTDNYNITYEYGLLKVKPLDVFIKTSDYDVIYNGKEQFNNSYECIESSILSNHSFEIEEYSSYKNVGSYSNIIKLKVKDENNEIVTNNYNIIYEYGLIIINKRSISIKPKDHEKTYDAISFVQDKFEIINGDIYPNEMIKIKTDSYIDAGSYTLKINDVNIFDNNIDVTNNFDINLADGNLIINKFDLIINPIDITHMFNGNIYNQYNCNDYLLENPLPKGKIEISVKYFDLEYNEINPKNVGNYLIKISDVLFIDESELNYNIIDNYSNLTITKRELNIAPLDIKDREYDTSYTRYSDEVNNFKILDDYNLTDDIKIKVDFNNGVNVDGLIGVKNAGTYSILFKDFIVENGSKDNYEIRYTIKQFTIKPKGIEIKPIDMTYYYGDIISYDKNEFISTYAFNGEIEVDYYKNGKLVTPKNVDIYEIRIKNVSYSDELETNFNPTFVSSTLIINKREVFVKLDLNNLSRNDLTYDGTELTYNTNSNNFNEAKNLQYDEELTIVVGFMQQNNIVQAINAGSYKLVILDYLIFGNKSNNYIITLSDEYNIEIKQKSITVKPIDQEMVYNGKKFDYNSSQYKIVFGEFDDEINIYVDILDESENIVAAINYGTYKIKIKSHEFIKGISSNYIISYETATLRILKRNVSISPIEINNKTYDGNYIEYPNYISNYNLESEIGFVNNDSITVNVKFYCNGIEYDRISEANNYEIKIVGYEFNNGNSDNYIINHQATKEVIIYQKEIIIKPNDITICYGDDIEFNGIFKEEEIEIEYKYRYLLMDAIIEPRNVGEYTIELYDINNLNKNYNVLSKVGILTINQRALNIRLVKANELEDKQYDGLKYTIDSFILSSEMIIDGNIVNGDIITINRKFADNKEALNADTYRVILDNYSVNQGLKENYDIQYEEYSFTISKVELEIELLNIPDKVFDNKIVEYSNENNNFNLIKGNIVQGEEIKIAISFLDEFNNICNPINVGTYKCIYESYSANKGTDNYNITCNNISFTISKVDIEINVRLDETEKMYDGTLFKPSLSYDINGNGITKNDLPELYFDYEFIDESNNIIEQIYHVGTYSLLINKVTNDDEILNNLNINIINENNSYIITKRNINLAIFDDEKIYDKENYKYNKGYYDLNNNNFCNQDYVILSFEYSKNNEKCNPVNVGEYSISIVGLVFNGEDINNYNISYQDSKATLTIKKRPICIALNNSEVTYSGNEYVYDNTYTNIENENYKSILDGDSFSISVGFYNTLYEPVNPVNAGLYHMIIEEAYQENQNYEINFINNATLTILPRNIMVKSKDIESITYGDKIYTYEQNYDNYTLIDGSLANGEKLMLIIKFKNEANEKLDEAKNASKYEIILDSYVTNNLGENDPNYIVNFVNESFEIYQKHIKLAAANKFEETTYGESFLHDFDYYLSNYTILEGSVAYGEKFTCKLKATDRFNNEEIKNAGIYTVSLNYFETNNLGKNDSNYDVVFNEYEFEIKRRNLTVKPNDVDSITYNGNNYEYMIDNYDLGETSLAYDDSISVSVIYKNELDENVNAKYAGSYKIFINEVNFKNGNEENYNITILEEYALLIINKLNLMIKPLEIEDRAYNGLKTEYPDNYNNFKVLDDISIPDLLSVKVSIYNSNNELDEAKNVGSYYARINEVNAYKEECLSSYEFDYNYDESFNINVLSISVKPIIQDKVYDNEAFTYNGDYEITPYLGKNDVISIDLVYYENNNPIAPLNVGIYTAKINKLLINGEESNKNYDITKIDSTFEILQKEVIIKPYSYNTTYNKQAFSYSNELNNFTSISGLLNEIDLKITVKYFASGKIFDSAINANKYQIIIDKVEAYNDLDSAFNNYKFKTSDDKSYLTISPEKIYLRAEIPENKVYDGIYISSLDYKGYELSSGTIYEGDTITLNCLYNNSSNVKDAGIYDVSVNYYTLNGTNYYNVDSNYKIFVETNSFEIFKREITLKPIDMDAIYNGLEISYNSEFNNFELDNSSLMPLSDEEIKISVEFLNSNKQPLNRNPINVGLYYSKYTDFTLSKGKKENYNIISNKLGEINIIDRRVKIKPSITNSSHIYDGSVISEIKDYEIVSYSGILASDIPAFTINTKFKNLETNEVLGSIKDSGKYEVYITAHSHDGNYIFVEYESVQYEIKKRGISLSLNDYTYTYNGSAQYVHNNYEIISENKFVEDDKIAINYKYYLNDLEEEPINSNTYKMVYQSYEYINCNDNYIISFNNTEAFLTINPSKLEIEIKDNVNYQYSNTKYELDNKYYNIISNGLFNNDDFVLDGIKYTLDINGLNEVDPIKVNTYYMFIEGIRFIRGDASNYDIEFIGYKTLEITKRIAIITLFNDPIIYDGINHSYQNGFDNYLNVEGLLNNSKARVEVKYKYLDKYLDSIINAGSYIMEARVLELDNDSLDNYNFEFNNTTQEIIKRSIIVMTGSKEFNYDDLEKSFEEYHIKENEFNLVLDHTLYTTKEFKVVNAGSYNNEIVVGVKDALNNDLTENYDISYEYGEIIINKRSIKVKTLSTSLTFNGDYQSYDEYEIIEGSLISGHEVSVNSVNNRNAGVYDNILQLVIYSSSFEKTSNYDISYEYGTVTITPLDISIEFVDYSFEYTGIDYIYDQAIGLDNIYDPYNVIYSCINSSNNVAKINEIGVYSLSNMEIYIDEEMMNNYNITYLNSSCSVTVLAKNINVTTLDYNGYYNGSKQYQYNYNSNFNSEIHYLILSDNQPYVIYPGDRALNKLLFKVVDSSGNDVTNNYNIIYDRIGELYLHDTIYLRYSNTKTYNGLEFTNIVENINVYDVNNELIDNYIGQAISYNIYDNNSNLISNPSRVGTYKLKLNDYDLFVDGNIISDEILNMYNIIDEGNTFTIEKINIDVKPLDASFTYNGLLQHLKGYYNNSNDYYEGCIYDNVLQNHVVILNMSSNPQINAGTYKNEITDLIIYDTLTNQEIELSSDYDGTSLKSKYEYYNITYRSDESTDYIAKLKIKPREIWIKTNDASKEYDGTALTDSYYEIVDLGDTNCGLVDGHYIKNAVSNSIVFPSRVKHSMTLVIYDNNDIYQGNNYRVKTTSDSGYLEITKKKIEVEITNGIPSVTSGGLVDGHYIYYENNEVIIKNQGNVDFTRYYDVTIIN